MKRTLWYLIGLGIIIGLGYMFATHSSTVTVSNTATSTPEEVKQPSTEEKLEQATQAMISEAIAAKQAEINAAKEAAAKKVEDAMRLSIERDVRQKLSTTNKERVVEIEKQTKVYWRDKRNVIALIKQYFPKEPIMVEVARGESGLQQWHEDGTLVKGRVDPRDSGLFQINSGSWDKEAKRLGLDYKNNIEDNVKMARHICDTQGITAWVYYTDHLAQR